MKSSSNLRPHYVLSKPMETFNPTTIHLSSPMRCDDPTPSSGGTPSATRSKLLSHEKPGRSYAYRLEDAPCHSAGSVEPNVMQQMSLQNTKAASLSKDLLKKLNWISIKRSLPLSELYAHSSPSAWPMISVSSKSIAKTPSSTVEAISRYTSNNLKDSSTPIILISCFCSTKRYTASNNHHVYDTYLYQRSL